MISYSMRSQRGYTLIEIGIAIALSSLVILGSVTIINNFNVKLRGTTQQSSLNALRAMIMQELNKPSSWVRTYTNNASFLCVLNLTEPCPDVTVPDAGLIDGGTIFNLYRGNDSVVISYGAAKGFDYNGVICNTYPSARCPIRVTLRWEMVTQGGGYLPGGGASGAEIYFPSGYFTAGYFSSLGLTSGYYGYIGNNPGQVKVMGIFEVFNDPGSNRGVPINTAALNFSMIKDVP